MHAILLGHTQHASNTRIVDAQIGCVSVLDRSGTSVWYSYKQDDCCIRQIQSPFNDGLLR